MTTTNLLSQPCSCSIPVKIDDPEVGLPCELPDGHATNHRATVMGYDGRKYVYYHRTARQEAERRELVDSVIDSVIYSVIDDMVAGNDSMAYITDIADPERSDIEHVVISRGNL